MYDLGNFEGSNLRRNKQSRTEPTATNLQIILSVLSIVLFVLGGILLLFAWHLH